jgi:hypothetical protein
MAGITYEDALARLTPEARTLFAEMVDAHLASAGTGDRLFIRSDSMTGTGMIFTGGAPAQRNWRNFDGGAIDDLLSYGLLHLDYSSRGTPNYRVSGEGLAFYRWLMERQGEALAQVEDNVQRLVWGDEFAKAHGGAAHHLREAFDLLWTGRTDDQVVSEVGDHLRKALMDMTNDVVGVETGGKQEQPIDRLDRWLADSSGMAGREAAVIRSLVELARAVLRLDHRLNHIRDEADKGEPPATWEEARRAAFTTAFVCHELDRASRRL